MIYRGGATIEEKAAVLVKMEAVGFVEAVHAMPGAQRVVIRVAKANQLHRDDRFLPWKTERGTGFRVIPGGGEPLADGAEIEAGLTPSTQSAGTAPVRKSEPMPAVPPEPSREQARAARNELDWRAYRQVPASLRSRVDGLAYEVQNLPPAEVEAHLEKRHRELEAQFDEEIEAARKRGDTEAMRQLRKLSRQTERMLRRLAIEYSKNRR